MKSAKDIRALDKPFVVEATDLDAPTAWKIPQGHLAAHTRSRPGRTTPNEDALGLFPVENGCVLVVADGVGGSQQAGDAARMILTELGSSLKPPYPHPDAIRGCVLDALENANRRLLTEYRDAAATVVVAIMVDRRVRAVHAGDCAALLFGQRGKLKYQTVSHSPVGFAQESGLIGEQEAIEHEDRHLISNAVGARDMRIEVGPWLDLAPQDRLLLASDGIYDNLLLDEIIEVCRKGDVHSALCSLADRCLNRMTEPGSGAPSKPDDATAILLGPARK